MEVITQIRVITSKTGGQWIPENERGTWAIEEVAIEYLRKLESIIGIPIMVSNAGGSTETTGTWAIKQVTVTVMTSNLASEN
jgi:hypothetical protein